MKEKSGSNDERGSQVGRFTWLIRIRWYALGIILGMASLLSYIGFLNQLNSIIIIIILGVFLNLGYYLALNRDLLTQRIGPKEICLCQILTDMAGILAIVHFTGGLTNPFIFFIAGPVIVAAIFFQPWWTYVLAFIAWGLAGCLGLLEGYRVLEQHPIFPGNHGTDLSVFHALKSMNLLVLGGFLFTCAYLTCKIVSALRKREWHLAYLQTSMQAYRKGRAAVADLKRTALAGFANGINSEVKDPMGIIRARVHAMQYDLEDNGFRDTPIYDDLNVIVDKVNQVDGTIDKIIAFLNHSPDSKESLNLRTVIHGLLEKMTPVFEDNRVHVKARIGSNLPEFKGSPRELNYLFLSLLQNAVDACQGSPAGKISVYARSMGNSNPDQGYLVIRIRDNGPGIPPGVQERIFDPFYSTRSKDRGMGLAIAYTIVRNHDGELRVRSRPPPGTSVTVILPLHAANAPEAAKLSHREVRVQA